MTDDRMTSAVQRSLAGLGLVLDDLAVTPAGRRTVVRVLVDRDLDGLGRDDHSSPVPPLTLDEIADATRAVSDTLDGTAGADGEVGDDLMGSTPYTLEVSSPGVDRALVGWRAYRRNVGRLAAFVLESGDVLTARILAVGGEPTLLTLQVPAAKKTPAVTREVALEDVTSAIVQVEFSRPASAGPGADDPTDDDADDDDFDDDTEYDALDPTEETDDGH